MLRTFLLILLYVAASTANLKLSAGFCDSFDSPKMRNIGYLLSGYDIFFGNPLPTGTGVVDPGFRQSIFIAEYDGSMTQDGRYCVPEGLEILSCAGSCNLDFHSKFIAGGESYHESLGFKAGVDIGGGTNKWGAGFGASISFGHVEERTSDYKSIFTQSEASCCAYTAHIQEYIHPNFGKNFIFGLATLSEEYDEPKYRRFINTFGTHYIKEATMGAIYGLQAEYTYDAWTTMVSDNFDIGLNANFGAMVSADFSIDWNKTESEYYNQHTFDKRVYSRGAAPPADQNSNTWMTAVISEPNTLTIKMAPLYELYLLDHVTQTVVNNLQTAIDGYCAQIKEEGHIKSCEAPPPDPPIPKPRMWSWWSTNNEGYNHGHGLEFPVQECPEGQYMTGIRFKEWAPHYGIVDVKIKCSGEFFWRQPVVGNYNHHGAWVNQGTWNSPMYCKEDGFRQMTAREQEHGLKGIVNVQAFCRNQEIGMTSNDNMEGEYNPDLKCRNGGQAVGVSVREEIYHGIIDFKIECA